MEEADYMSAAWEYDGVAGALYVRFNDAEVSVTERRDDNVLVDRDAHGEVRGIEIVHLKSFSDTAVLYDLSDQVVTFVAAIVNELRGLQTSTGIGTWEPKVTNVRLSVRSSATADRDDLQFA